MGANHLWILLMCPVFTFLSCSQAALITSTGMVVSRSVLTFNISLTLRCETHDDQISSPAQGAAPLRSASGDMLPFSYAAWVPPVAQSCSIAACTSEARLIRNAS